MLFAVHGQYASATTVRTVSSELARVLVIAKKWNHEHTVRMAYM